MTPPAAVITLLDDAPSCRNHPYWMTPSAAVITLLDDASSAAVITLLDDPLSCRNHPIGWPLSPKYPLFHAAAAEPCGSSVSSGPERCSLPPDHLRLTLSAPDTGQYWPWRGEGTVLTITPEVGWTLASLLTLTLAAVLAQVLDGSGLTFTWEQWGQ